jgi:hypothetical protein
MRLVILFAALSFAGAAVAETPVQGQRTEAPMAKEGGRVVFVCDSSAEVWRSWIREHGELTFVSATELARAQAEKKTWTSPRCITAAELERYESLAGAARVLKASGN